jgi:hypothetical protein
VPGDPWLEDWRRSKRLPFERQDEKLTALTDLAKVAFEASKEDQAAWCGEEMFGLTRQFGKDWNYGNAIY